MVCCLTMWSSTRRSSTRRSSVEKVTARYMQAAKLTLAGDSGAGAFRFTKRVTAGDLAVLEFETTVDGKYVNGVDILRCDDTGSIVEIRVMIRPLQAIDVVHKQMRAMVASLQP